MAAKYGSLQQNQWVSFQLEDTAYNFGAGQTNAIVRSVGGIYRATLPTYTDGDAAMAHFTAAGRLMVDTELTLDGNVIINNLGGAAAKDAPIAGNPLQMGTEAATFDGLALPTAVNAEGDVTYPKSSLQGVMFVSPLNADGSLTTIYGEDSVHTTGHGGTFVLAVRNDAGTTLVDANGDYAPLSVDSNGALHVALTNVDYVDDSAFVVATDRVLGVGLMADEAAIDSVDEGDIGIPRMTLNRQTLVTQRLTDGTELAYGAGGVGVTVPRTTLASDDPAVTALQIIDDWDETDRAKVNLIVGQAGIAAGSAAIGATTPSVTLATNDPAVTSLSVMDDWDNVAYAETENEASNSAFTTSVMYGMDTEAVATSQLRAAQVAVDNAGLSATPNVLVTGGIFKAAPLDTYGDNDAVPFHFDTNGRLLTDANITIEGFDYTDDSAEFTVASSKGLAVMGIATTDSVDSGDVGALAMTTSRRLHVASSSLNNPAVVNASAALAINTTTAIANHFRLVCVTCRFNIAPVTSQNFVVTLDANDGAAYDTVLFSVDPSASAATSIVYIPDKELIFESGDEILATFTNTDARTYGLRIVTQLL